MSAKKVKELREKISGWSKQNIIDVCALLQDLQALAEGGGKKLSDLMEPDEVPTYTLPTGKNLTHVWAVDTRGMALVMGNRGASSGRFKIMPVDELPDAKGAGLGRNASYKKQSITLRLEPEVKEAIELSMHRHFERSMSAWIRATLIKRLKEEEIL